MHHQSGYGFTQDVLFDLERMKTLFSNKWFFVGTRADVSKARNFFKFTLFNEEYFLLHGSDGKIRCMVNRCAHQSARLLNDDLGRCAASIICPNHQWAYQLNGGELRNAAGMSEEFHQTHGADFGLTQIPLREIDGMLFACLNMNQPPSDDMDTAAAILAPYTAPFLLADDRYKLAAHHREIIPASWLVVMINNRECCHCAANHKQLLKLFDSSSFNGASTPDYEKLKTKAIKNWQQLGLQWQEDAFVSSDEVRVARYPVTEGFKSISFDGKPVCSKTIGPFEGLEHNEGTLSFWFNPNAWIHFTSDHIATNWVLPVDENHCQLFTSWIVAKDAVEGVDYQIDHLTEVWKVTNAEDVGLCISMNEGAKSQHYKPGPFSENERFCTQFVDWYIENSK